MKPGKTSSGAGAHYTGPRSISFLLVFFFVLLAAALWADGPGHIELGAPAGGTAWYVLVPHKGVFHSPDSAGKWLPCNEGLPKRVVYPFDDQGLKDITSLGVDSLDPKRIAVTTSSRLFFSDDGGRNFREIPLGGAVAYSNYITSVSVGKKGTFYLGTSFNGYFKTVDEGKNWQKLSENTPQLYRGAGFYEEISGIAVDNADGRVALGTSFTSRVYLGKDAGGPWQEIAFPYSDEIRGLWFAPREGGANLLQVWGDRGVYTFENGGWTRSDLPFPSPASAPDPQKVRRTELASGKYGIYVNPSHASGEKLAKLLDFLTTNGMNTVTVDMKDDWGWITYDSALDSVAKVGSSRPRFKLDELIQACHDRGVYVVGRVVVFKDKRMYLYQGNKYAIWDSVSDSPWGNRFKVKNEETGKEEYEQREFWVDPFCQDVWEYNLSIAKELQDRGVDEIQFDYIRFPSDGDVTRAKYRFRRSGMSRIEALESFLAMTREKISVPISTDLYGFNSWYRMGNWIGQNIELVSHYVDVICPMYYPSHFPRQFMKDVPYLDRAERIYREGSMRSARIAAGRSVIRPYVQAFLLPFEYYMEEPEYTEYLRRQLKGAQDSPASGFTLWNSTNRYYMVTEPLYSFTSSGEKAVGGEKTGESILE